MKKSLASFGMAGGAAVGLLGLGFLCLAAGGQVQGVEKWPRPTGQELSKAEKVVQEVFGRDIAKARTPSEKGKLAQEILRAAREEQDPAVRFAALEVARRLAVSAQDGRLGLEIVREMVARFQPLEEMPPAERLAEADRLWQQAERLNGQEKLEKQLEAAEEWLNTNLQNGITVKKWVERFKKLEDQIVFAYIPTASDKKISQMLHGKTIMLINKKSGHTMNVRNASKTPTKFNPHEHVVQLATPEGQPSGQWIVNSTKEGYIFLQNCNSKLWLGKYLGPDDPPGHPPVAAQQEEQNKDIFWIFHPIDRNSFFIIHAETGLYLRPWNGVTYSNYGLHLYKKNENDDSFVWLLRVCSN
jgi:hypothetical protein